MLDSKRSIFAWAFYDWGNSAFATTVMAGFFPVFFSAYWAVGSSSEEATFYLGLANSIGSLIVALLAPFLGAIADWGSYKKRMLAFFALLGSVMTASLYILQMGSWPLAVFFYSVAVVGFSGANTFYDALLPFVASEKKVDFVSSLGYSLGYIGGGLLFLVNVLMYLNPSWFGFASQESAIKACFVIVGIWWIVFTLPLLFILKEEGRIDSLPLKKAIAKGLRITLTTIKSFRQLKTIALFLVAYWLYIDGVDTIIRMAVNYGTSLNFPSESLIIALLITQFVAFPSALAYSSIGTRIGIKKALLVAIGAYTIIAILGYFMTTPLHFYLLAIIIGLFQGGIQALSRSYYTRLIPKQRSAEFFGFYNMLGKFAAIIGPLLMGVVTILTKSVRAGIFSLVALFVFGFILLYKVDEEKGQKEIEIFLKEN
jgi:UMF1 family MFS transporter